MIDRSVLRRAAGVLFWLMVLAPTLRAQDIAQSASVGTSNELQPSRKPWYERFSLRGYTQVRYNRLLESNPDLTCAQCDRTIGRNGGLSIRRSRLVLSGDINDRVSVYLQPDFATDVGGSLHVLQMRDLYFDVFLNAAREVRIRVGQSKVPWGFENLQSSSNRLPFDRADALNSGVPNERDVGVFVYWTPSHVRERFRILTDSGLKGTGDYGVMAVGAYNGQTANRADANNSLHSVARVSYPLRFANGQFVEIGVQAVTGRFVIPASQRTVSVAGASEFRDERIAGSMIVYPQPFGVQAEWTTGTGPEIDPAMLHIDERNLGGGYVQLMYRYAGRSHTVIPFVRAQQYDGGKKHETDARSYDVREIEMGIEWVPMSALEFTAVYTESRRRFEDGIRRQNVQEGRMVRVQLQVSY